jgi:D-beta-D-heptose 7-phosphate kinase/D-beta-D-heptose 1-phosphate adenosyltransferase
VDRISPEAPVPVVSVKRERLKLGLAANVAENVVSLGGHCDLVSVMGDDAEGKELSLLLRSAKIDASSVVVEKGRKTTLKERIVCDGQQIVRVDHETREAVKRATARAVMSAFSKKLETAQIVIVQDYAKGLLDRDMLKEVFSLARRRGVRVFVDPNSNRPVTEYRGATLLTPNRREAEVLSGLPAANAKQLGEAGQEVLRKTRSEELVLTLGSDGMAVFAPGKKRPTLIPTAAREVFDVSGAGDTVVATLALLSAAGAPLAEAAYTANLAAGVVVGKRGTASITRGELESALEAVVPSGNA